MSPTVLEQGNVPLSRERVVARERKAVRSCTRHPEMFIHPRHLLAVNESAISRACRPWQTLQNTDSNEQWGMKALIYPIKLTKCNAMSGMSLIHAFFLGLVTMT